MAFWTPLNLATHPRLLLQPSGMVFSGTTLTGWTNQGTDGGAGTVLGAPVKGTVYNGLNSIRFDAGTKCVQYTLGTFAHGGSLFFSGAFALLSGASVGGLVNNNWGNTPAVAGACVFYGAVPANNQQYSFMFDNGLNISPGEGINFSINDLLQHQTDATLGLNLEITDDDVVGPQEPTLSNPAVTVDIPSTTWEVGRGDGVAPGEGINADVQTALVIDYEPSLSEKQYIRGWESWLTKGNGSLVSVLNPFRWTQPDTTGYLSSWIRSVGPQASRAGTGSISLTLPTYAVGDQLLIIVETANQPVSTPSGYGVPSGASQGTGTAGGTAATCIQVFRKTAGASETGPSVSVTGDHVVAAMVAVANCDATTPLNITAGAVAAAASTSVSMPTATSTVPTGLVMNIVSWATDTATAQGSSPTNAGLSQITELGQISVTDGNGGGFALWLGLKAAAGATGATTATLATSSVQGLLTLVFAPPQVSTVALTGRTSIKASGRPAGTFGYALAGRVKVKGSGRGFISQVINMSARTLLMASGRTSFQSVILLTGRGAAEARGRAAGVYSNFLTGRTKAQASGRPAAVFSAALTGRGHVQSAERAGALYSVPIFGSMMAEAKGRAVMTPTTALAARMSARAAGRLQTDSVTLLTGRGSVGMSRGLGALAAAMTDIALTGRASFSGRGRAGMLSTAFLEAQGGGQVKGHAPMTGVTALTGRAAAHVSGAPEMTASAALTGRSAARAYGRLGAIFGAMLSSTLTTQVRGRGGATYVADVKLTGFSGARISGRALLTLTRPAVGKMIARAEATAQMIAEADQL